MAEFVEFRAEEWLPELEQMQMIQLFDQKEIKSIATKRRELEYKIQRQTKSKEDFLNYIQFEVDLHRIIKARRKKTGIRSKKAEIDHSQTHRIANLFKQVIFKFQNDVKLWMSFFKFCQGVNFHSLVSQMLVRMLQVHADKPDLWAFAAQWEFEECGLIDNARQFLTRGLRHHPLCDMLYEELFKLELEHIREKLKELENKQKEDENWVPDKIMNSVIEGKVAEVVYESAVKKIMGVEFKVKMLNIAKKKRSPKSIQNMIFRDIVKNHIKEELTWDTIAKEEFAGFKCNLKELIEEEGQMDIDERNESDKLTMRDRIQRSVAVYEEGVQKLNTVKMWSYYLDFIIKLSKNAKSLPVFKAKLLNNAMEGALSSGKLTEDYYLQWISILQKTKGKNKKLIEVAKKGTEQYPKSLQLWHIVLKFYFIHDQEELGMEMFREGVKHLLDAAPLWSLVVKYLLLNSSPKIEKIFQNGIEKGGEVAETLKPFYIEWLTLTKGIEEARKIFESPEMIVPPNLQFYHKMASLELSQPQPNLERVRKCHELACSEFGRENPSVWLDYIRFELKEGEKSKITQIHRRALKTLKHNFADEFLADYNNFKIST